VRFGHSRWSWICVGLLPVAVLAYFYAPLLVLYFQTKQFAKANPNLSKVPSPLATYETANASGKPRSFFSLQFRTPWTGEPEVRQYDALVTIRFPQGQFVALFDPAKGVNRIKIIKDSKPSNDPEIIFGSQAMQSNYAFVSAILNTTPNDVSLKCRALSWFMVAYFSC
jgi:hypothetical protein